MKVTFITEGHITRCLSLFTAFKERNINGAFIINGDAEMKDTPHKICNWNKNAQILHEDILTSDIVILDSLYANNEVIKEITQYSRLPVFIDDYRRLTYDRGVIIDWTPFIEKKYTVSSNSNCSYLLGCQYVSLRKPFWNIAEKKINVNVSEILLTMGGGDIRNICPKILNLLLNHTSGNILKTVAIGQSFSKENIIELKRISENNPSCELVFFPDENKMLNLFLKADIVISAGGQTLYELARVGAPTIAVLIIDNQITDIEGWLGAGFIDYAGSWEDELIDNKILIALNNLIANQTLRLRKNKIGRSCVDGLGTKRIVDHLLSQIDKL
jgi:spore coat polysaccharide biosynthesis predicted glycosyltransferase SpsG